MDSQIYNIDITTLLRSVRRSLLQLVTQCQFSNEKKKIEPEKPFTEQRMFLFFKAIKADKIKVSRTNEMFEKQTKMQINCWTKDNMTLNRTIELLSKLTT